LDRQLAMSVLWMWLFSFVALNAAAASNELDYSLKTIVEKDRSKSHGGNADVTTQRSRVWTFCEYLFDLMTS